MEQKKKKKVGLFIVYGLITVIILYIVLSANDFGAIMEVLGTADLKYILIALALVVLYTALAPLTTCMLVRAKRLNISFKKTYAISMTEQFFNGITPFAMGGQPFQVYEFSRAKIKAADSTGVLLMNFIITMIVINAYSACALAYYSRFIDGNLTIQIIAIVGYSINFLSLAFFIALATSERLKNLIFRICKVFCKIKFVGKRLEPKLESFSEYLTNMQEAFDFLWNKTWTFIGCLALRALVMGINYALTFYVLRALGIPVGYEDFFFVLCGSSFAITAVVFMPTPGSSGGIEFAFKSVFFSLAGGVITQADAYAGMLIWRLLTYYLVMALSLVFYIGLEIYFGKVRKKEEASSPSLPADPDIPPDENQ